MDRLPLNSLTHLVISTSNDVNNITKQPANQPFIYESLMANIDTALH